jgi:hypothetical protein
MHNKISLDTGAGAGESRMMNDLKMEDGGVACIAHEQEPSLKYSLKILEQHFISDLECLTIQMKSTRYRSDDSLPDCL